MAKIIQLVGLLFLMSLGIIACSETKDPNAIDEIKLSYGEKYATFLLPAAYQAEVVNNHLVSFRMKYPSLEAVPRSAYEGDYDIDVYMTLYNKPRNRADYIRSEALDQMNPEHPGQYYRAGKQGIYELFQYSFGSKPSTVFVFKAKDGNYVAVEDPGKWSVKYTAERMIGTNMEIKYLISKPIGNDFVHIDEIVANFIRNRLINVSN